eukprot:Opistho-1_new@54615
MKVAPTHTWHVSNMLSDILVAGTSFYCAYLFLVARRRKSYLGTIACLIIGVAASVGVLRFGPMPELLGWHKYLAAAGACVSFPLLGYASLRRWESRFAVNSILGEWFVFAVAIALFVGRTTPGILPPEHHELYDTVVPFIGLLGVISQSFLTAGGVGAIGAVIIILVSLSIGTEGIFLGVPAVDIFHVALSLGLRMITEETK